MKMQSGAALLAYLLLALSLGGVLGKDKPDIEKTDFGDIPAGLFYFEDSDVVLVTNPSSRTTYRSEDAGVKWKTLDGVDKGKTLEVLNHPYNNQVAVVIGLEGKHWITRNQGKKWEEWTGKYPPTLAGPAINFHATDPDRMLFMTAECPAFENCKERVYYTTDGFKSDPKLLLDDAVSCLWAKSTDQFTTGSESADSKRILCIKQGDQSPFTTKYRLLSSDDFFKTEDTPEMSSGNTPTGFMRLAAVKSYMVAAAKSEGTTELAMYVTDDAKLWHRAEFGEHKLEEDAYTILESTNYSMQVDVLTTKPMSPMGVLLTSNSNGTFFTKNKEHTNRNVRGYVDFEKIQNIQGIVLVNTVDNWEEVEKNWAADKKVKTEISFDDGRTWQSLKYDDKNLHLHSVTSQRNLGRIFSSPAPGIVMGVGNTGDYLRPFNEGDLFVSDDAGLTWRKARSKPHLYEFGDQGSILVAIEDHEGDELVWSLDHGKTWNDMDLPDDIKPIALTTVPDSTSLKFILTASRFSGSNTQYFIYSIDFGALGLDKCKDKDFEDWYARVDDDGKPTCIMGHKQKFRRRKADSKCFIDDKKFQEARPVAEDCPCTDEDFECDYENGFTHKDGKCELTGQMKQPADACQNDEKNFMGPSGYRLIPGNTCIKDKGIEKDKPVERPCKDLKKPAASGEIATEITRFKGDIFVEYYYLERGESSSGTDESVIMRTDRREAYISHDHGKAWEKVKAGDEEIVAVYPHQYINDNVYLITPSKKVYYSLDRGKNFNNFDAPETPNQDRIQILSFHPTEKDWLIWTGGKDCSGGNCQTIAHVSRKGGDDWTTLMRAVRKCQFVYREGRAGSEKLVYCEQHEDEDTGKPLWLYSSDDWFDTKTELKRDVINFATMAEYIVVAVRDTDQQSLQVDTSIDGKIFADAKFPSNFQVPHQQAYTVLDSSTHAVFLHVTVNNKVDQEYGSILKSNSNGTSYVHAVDAVNRNGAGYVDFEKMQGLEGVAVINRVANVKETDNGSAKKLKTWITHNDGADWTLIQRPKKAFDKKKFDCSGDTEKCSLHLHGYTERRDPRDTFSSPSAVGLMMATGNVGEYLGYKKDADTFITRDGGLTWEVVAPGNWMWEYGDQGSVLVIVKEDLPTKEIMYSLDEGKNWISYEFSQDEMVVQDITTVPSDTSLNFLLWGKIKGELVTVNLDFSGLKERSKKCKLDENKPEGPKSDYLLWSPKHPFSDNNCLFGHIAKYHRKKTDRDCYNGNRIEIQHLHSVVENCTCTREDFECDYNYERQSDASCKLVKGLKPAKPEAVCEKEGVKEYFGITGYRKIPITTCSGGIEFDRTPQSFPCPGYEDEWDKKHGLSGFAIFFIVILSVGAAGGIGYFVWKNWDGKFGRIRLGDGLGPVSAGASNGAFDRDAPWIKYPVMALSGFVAVIAAVPMLIGSLWSAVATRMGRSRGSYNRTYTSRSSFARGRGDYSIVGDDEGELLGEDSDEDI